MNKSDTNRYRTPLLMVGLVLSMGLVLFAFEWKTPIEPSGCGLSFPEDNIYLLGLLYLDEESNLHADGTNPKTYIIPSDNEEKDDELNPEIFEEAKKFGQEEVNEKTELEIPIEEEIVVEPIEEYIEPVEEPIIEEIDCFVFSEEEATPTGGMKVFYDYVRENINYPRLARDKQIEGKVFIEFFVDKDGSIINTKILRGVGGGCDEEALRVLRNSSKWQPARQRGRIVRQRMTFPIIFKLN
jgi:protein TonB